MFGFNGLNTIQYPQSMRSIRLSHSLTLQFNNLACGRICKYDGNEGIGASV